MVKVRGRQQQRGCALGQGAASARVTDTKTDAHTKAAAGFRGAEGTAGRLRLLQARCSFRLISISDTPPPRPDTRRHTSASTSIPVSYLRHPNPTVPLFLGGVFLHLLCWPKLRGMRAFGLNLSLAALALLQPTPSCLPLPPTARRHQLSLLKALLRAGRREWGS